MLFERYLMPDRMTEHYYNVTPDFLLNMGIRALICDIDNTLATYEQPDPPADLIRWCAQMRQAGIQIAFVSNNTEERVSRFNKAFGFPAYPDSGKPSPAKLRLAMEQMGTDVTSTAMLGDQLLTDALAARLCGLFVIIVPPIADKKNLFFRCKRWIEKPYIREYKRRHLLL